MQTLLVWHLVLTAVLFAGFVTVVALQAAARFSARLLHRERAVATASGSRRRVREPQSA